MITVCAKGPVTAGIDIYHGDQINDAGKLMPQVQFVYMKAFENVADPAFSSRWDLMRRINMIRGAYDFFHPAKDPLAQASSFCGVVGQLQDGDLPCALDWESTDSTPSETDRTKALTWLNHVEAVTKKTPVIYCSPYFAQALSLTEEFARFPLWVAHYGVKCPLVPAPWNNWTFWQSGESAKVSGMLNACDIDQFNGSLADLKAFIAKSKVV